MFPEIPCSFRSQWASVAEYRSCVELALGELVAGGALDERMRVRFLSSSLRAFGEEQ